MFWECWVSYGYLEQFGLHNTPHLLQHELAVSGDSVFLDMIAATRTNAVRSSLLQPQLLATSSAMSHCPKQEQNEQSAQNEKLKHKDSKDFQSTSAGTAKARPPLLSSTAAGEASLTHRSGKEFGDVDSRESTRTLYTYMYQTWYIYIYIRIYNIISHTHTRYPIWFQDRCIKGNLPKVSRVLLEVGSFQKPPQSRSSHPMQDIAGLTNVRF